MPERFRDELLTMGRYTNPASFTFFFTFHSSWSSFYILYLLSIKSNYYGLRFKLILDIKTMLILYSDGGLRD